jgi:hypothetical protein
LTQGDGAFHTGVLPTHRAGSWGISTARLEGNFPGGVADVAYMFSLKDGLIRRLTIE